jgi:hypothetical protein
VVFDNGHVLFPFSYKKEKAVANRHHRPRVGRGGTVKPKTRKRSNNYTDNADKYIRLGAPLPAQRGVVQYQRVFIAQ